MAERLRGQAIRNLRQKIDVKGELFRQRTCPRAWAEGPSLNGTALRRHIRPPTDPRFQTPHKPCIGSALHLPTTGLPESTPTAIAFDPARSLQVNRPASFVNCGRHCHYCNELRLFVSLIDIRLYFFTDDLLTRGYNPALS